MLLKQTNKRHWHREREDKIFAKGKNVSVKYGGKESGLF